MTKAKIATIATAIAISIATTASADQFSECMIREMEAEAGTTMNRAQRMALGSQAELMGDNFRDLMKQKRMNAPQAIEFFRRVATEAGIMDEGVAYILLFSMACSNHLDADT